MKEEHHCFTIKCDACHEPYENGDGDYMHFPTLNDAEIEAENCDWITVGDKHFCERCRPLCTCGHSFKSHDYGDDKCDEDGADEMKCPCEKFRV